MKKDPLSSKAPEKPMHDVSSGNSLLSSETILRTNKRGMAKKSTPLSSHKQSETSE
jgi:SH3 domain-containing kinase-binding protein 1